MSKIVDLTNKKFGRLTVIKLSDDRFNGEAAWVCSCSCGTEIKVRGYTLRSGNTKSCGCYRNEFMTLNHQKHGAANTVEYRTWQRINTRCKNQKSRDYENYGGRGILNNFKSFEDFLADVGLRPGPEYSIDRKDVNGHYERGNCKWSTRLEQNSNKRSVRKLAFNNKTMTIAAWARHLGIGETTIRQRLRKNLPIQEVLKNEKKTI